MLTRYCASLRHSVWTASVNCRWPCAWDRLLATQVAQETVACVDAARFTPQRLSESLAEFEGILSHREVQAAPEVVKTNHENFQTLMHFLKSYTKGLRKDEPLRQQLHTLEFIVPGYDDPASLRRLVVKVGTPGGSSGHKIVSRCIQGLFREAGVSPNFLWDEAFHIPDRYTSYEEQRKRLEEATLDEKVKQIQAAQRGEKLSNHGPLTMLKSEDYLPQAIAGEPDHVSAVDSAAHTSPPLCLPPQRESSHDVHGGEEIVDHESHGDDHAHEDLETFAADMDEKLRLLAMTPWIQAYGELRAEEEQKLANELIMFMSQVLPGFGTIVPHVWDGELDPEVLTVDLLHGHHDDIKPWITACAQQLCRCFEALLLEHGPPDSNMTISRKLLVKTTAPIAEALDLARNM